MCSRRYATKEAENILVLSSLLPTSPNTNLHRSNTRFSHQPYLIEYSNPILRVSGRSLASLSRRTSQYLVSMTPFADDRSQEQWKRRKASELERQVLAERGRSCFHSPSSLNPFFLSMSASLLG